MKHRFGAIAMLLVSAMVFSACGSDTATPSAAQSSTSPTASTASASTPSPVRPLVMLVSEPTQGLDPAKARASASTSLMSLIYEPLVNLDAAGGFAPGIAKSWDISPDGLTYTFSLNSEAKFSDGTQVTSADVAYSLDRARASDTYKGALSLVSAVAASGDKVIITLSSPSSAFLRSLTNAANAAILSKAAVEGSSDYFTLPKATSGPWQLTEYIEKDHASLEANPGYWDPSRPLIKSIRFTFSGDQSTRAAAVESGSADFAAIGYNDAQRLRQGGQIPVIEADTLSVVGFGWDRTKPPFNDLRVREAFAYAFDRQARKDACWFGTGAISWGGTLRPWDPNYVEVLTYKVPRDEGIQKAADLLQAAGWIAGADGTRTAQGIAGIADGTPFKVTVPYEGNWTAGGCQTLLLQSNMKDLGLDIEPQSHDPASFYTDAGDNKFTMWHMGNGAAESVSWYMGNFHTGGAATNLITKATGEYDALIDEAVSSTDPARVKAIFAQLEYKQADELPALFTGFQFSQIATSPALSGYVSIPGGLFRGLIYADFQP